MKSVPRTAFLGALFDCWGVPYIWDGKYPATGLDCSGLVAHAYWHAGGDDLRLTHNAQHLHDMLPETEAPKVGDLCFYGSSAEHISHVVVWLGGTVYGASGGNSDTTTPEIAAARGARVKLKPSHLYRPDFRGWRRLPFTD